MDKFELVKFTDNNFEINVRADIDNDTVWLTQKAVSYTHLTLPTT